MTEPRKLRAQCVQAKAKELRDRLQTSEAALQTKLDGWNEMAFSAATHDEEFHNRLTVANGEAQSNVQALVEALSPAEKALAEMMEAQKASSAKGKK